MPCTCLLSLLNLIKPPWATLPPIHIPPIVAQLNASGLAGAKLMADASAMAALSASLSAHMNLPSLTVAASLTAAATAVAQLKAHLGINLLLPDAAMRLSVIFEDINLFPFPSLTMPQIGPIGPLLAMAGVIRAHLGVNIFTPGADVALHAAIKAMLAASARINIPLPALKLVASYAAVAKAAAALDCSENLGLIGSRMQSLAQLRLPKLNLNPMLLAQLLHYLATLAAAQQMLGFNPFAIDAQLKVQAMLPGLKLLANLKADAALAEALALGQAVAAASSGLAMSASFSAIAKLNLSAAVAVKLPSLAPPLMLGAVFAQAKKPGTCSSSCPVKI